MQPKLKVNEILIAEQKLSYEDLDNFVKNHHDDDFFNFLQIPPRKTYCVVFHYQGFTINTYSCETFALDLDEEDEMMCFYTLEIKYGHYLNAITESSLKMKDFKSLLVRVLGKRDSNSIIVELYFNLPE